MFGGPRGSLPAVRGNRFSEVPHMSLQRSAFDRSHGFKTTLNAGYLVPIFWDEILPGDTFRLRTTAFARLATPQVPIMDSLYADFFFFFIPNRLVQSDWVRLMGERTPDPDSTIDILTPQVPAPESTGFVVGSLYDYFGIPTGIDGFSVNNYAGRAYNLTYNEWFRDENLQDSVVVDLDNGPDSESDYQLLRSGKRHDYFTSCLPEPQKGDSVRLPLTGNAPVYHNPGANTGTFVKHVAPTEAGASGAVSVDGSGYVVSAGNPSQALDWDPAFYGSGESSLIAAMDEVTAATVNQIRQAFMLQSLLELDARGGTRYQEILLAHFQVDAGDSRLQRPEYLGGGSQRLTTTPIPQTSATGETGTPQANLAAIGTFSVDGPGFVKSFVEHGHVLGLIRIRADLNYQQGLHKMWSRRSRYDFYWPMFARLGEQAVLNKEIYLQGTSADDEPFGYQEFAAEYRYKPSLITGQFRSTYAQSLDVWHLAQEFETLPELGPAFIVEDPPVDRVIATGEGYPQFLLDVAHQLHCARPMPMYSIPAQLGGRF